MSHVCQRKQVDTKTEITPQNAYRPFSSVIPNRQTEVVAPMASVTPEATEIEHDNVVTETRDIAVFTPIPGLPRITSPARKTGRSHVASEL